MPPALIASKILRSHLYLAYLAVAVLGLICFFFWHPFVDGLQRDDLYGLDKTVRHVDRETFRQLGSVVSGDDRKESHFTFFSKEKPSGTVRICTLGDSFTFGAETGQRHDYPSYLQRFFEAEGANNVQVINFANSWYGFSQIMIMWESVASGFACDFVLLTPMAFWSKRDSTFNHSDLRNPDYLHARYVLEGNDVRLVPVIGDSGDERFDAYFGFLPKWRYLRYDRNPPAVVRSLLPQGNTVRNWFYYDARTVLAESHELYERLARKMSESAENLVIGLFDRSSTINDYMLRVKSPNVTVLKADFPGDRFPYHSPVTHHSAWANEQKARMFFAAMTGEDESALDGLVIWDSGMAGTGPDEPVPLHEFDSISLAIGDRRIGIINPVSKAMARKFEGRFDETLGNSRIVTLLALKTREMSLSDACMIPLDYRPDAGTAVRVVSMDGAMSVDTGDIRYPLGNVNIAVADTTFSEVRCLGKGVWLVDGNAGDTYALHGTGVRMLLGNSVVLEGKRKGSYLTFEKGGLSPYRFRATGEYLADYERLAPAGKIHIVLKRGDSVAREPIFEWHKSPAGLALSLPRRGENRIVIRDGRAHVRNRRADQRLGSGAVPAETDL